MRFLSRVLILALAGVLLVSCGWGSRMASEKQQQVIEDEFRDLLAETVENAQANTSHFKYSGGRNFDVGEVDELRPATACDNDNGTTLYRLYIKISADGQYNSQERQERMTYAMSQKWEAAGREVQYFGSEILFYTEAGTKVSYLADASGERIKINTACVLPADPDPSASSS